MKNEEISNFACTLKQSLDNLEVQKHTRGLLTQMCPVCVFFPVVTQCFFFCCCCCCDAQANSNKVQEDLESEFTSLHSVLDEMKENMLTRIKQERAGRTYELQVSAVQLKC